MRRLGHHDLRDIVVDTAELAKGARYADDGGLSNLARHGDRLYGDAAGAAASPYKVTVTLTADKAAARCSCMAARTRPFCKHAAALLVSWANAPDAFAESDRPPPGAAGDKKRTPKAGKKDVVALRGDGVARAIALVRELAASGVASVGEGRADAVRALGESLRAGTLRRLAARVFALAALLDAAGAGGRVAAAAWAELLCDVLLTARKIEKHLGGEPLDDRHVEELIGKTWRKTDRAAVHGLDLVEYAHERGETADGFVIRQARYLDVAGGDHYASKQILPAFLARRTPPLPSRAGLVLNGAGGSLYPGFAPRRLDLEEPGDAQPLTTAVLARLLDAALPGVDAALAALQAHRRDPFAPDALPVAVRAHAIDVDGARLRVVDDAGATLALPEAGDGAAATGTDDALSAALRDVTLRAVIGAITLDRALPVLIPAALVVARGEALALRTIAAPAVPEASDDGAERIARARAAGASAAAVSLAEVRDEVAELLAQGLAAFTPRAVEAPAARLAELGLGKPAELLRALAERPIDGRLEDVVRVHQVLGVALIRVVGTTPAPSGERLAVPTHPSVRIARPARWLGLDEAMAGAARGELDRWCAATHAARALAEVPAATLLTDVDPWWSLAALSPLVAARLASVPGAAAIAQAVLVAERRAGRVAQRTAIRVLVGADAATATRAVVDALGRDGDPSLRGFALDQIDLVREATGDRDAAARRRTRGAVVTELTRALVHASAVDDRRRAALALGEHGDDAAAGALRRAWVEDRKAEVREAAALALGRLGDAAAIDGFVAALAARASDGERARAAALGLGAAGDAAGAAALVAALVDGWRAPMIADCLRGAGVPAARRLLEAVEATPALAKKKTAREVFAALSPGDAEALVAARLAAAADDATRAARAEAHLALAGAGAGAGKHAAGKEAAVAKVAFGVARAVVTALRGGASAEDDGADAGAGAGAGAGAATSPGKAAQAAIKRAQAVLGD